MASNARQKRILAKLSELYPDPRPELHFTDPYQTLIAVMLSAQSTDVQVNKATPALFARYPTVAALAAASNPVVALLIAGAAPMFLGCVF